MIIQLKSILTSKPKSLNNFIRFPNIFSSISLFIELTNAHRVDLENLIILLSSLVFAQEALFFKPSYRTTTSTWPELPVR
jgi:hypothetical protein